MRKMQLLTCFVLIVSFIVSVTVGCAKPTPAPTAAPTTAPTTAPTSAPPATTPTTSPTASPTTKPAEVFTLRWSSDSAGPPTSFFGGGQDRFMTEVEKRTNGRVKFQRYWSGALNPSKEALTATSKGTCDIANIVNSYFPGPLALSNVTTLPGVTKNMWAALKANRELHQLPELIAELKKNNIMYLAASGASDYLLHSTKPIKTLADLKGLKLRSTGMQSDLLQALGAVPISMTSPEIYEALQRGTIDGLAGPYQLSGSYKFYEVAKYVSNIGLGANAYLMPINLDTWNKLPKDIQDIMLKVATEYHDDAMYSSYYLEGDIDRLEKVMKPAGVQIIEAPAADIAKVKEISSQAIWSKWAAEQEKAGLPGNKILAKWIELTQKWEAKPAPTTVVK